MSVHTQKQIHRITYIDTQTHIQALININTIHTHKHKNIRTNTPTPLINSGEAQLFDAWSEQHQWAPLTVITYKKITFIEFPFVPKIRKLFLFQVKHAFLYPFDSAARGGHIHQLRLCSYKYIHISTHIYIFFGRKINNTRRPTTRFSEYVNSIS